MEKRMIYLITLIAELSKRIEISRVYSNKFKASGNNYLSPTEVIRIDQMTNHFVTAGIVGRNDSLPIVNKDGFAITEFEPDIIGGELPYSASDILQLQAGIPMITSSGAEIPTIEQLENKYGKILAAAIGNRFEKQCAEAYLKGTYTDKAGKALNVGVVNEEALTFNAKTKYSDEILKLMIEYHKKNSVFPNVEVGEMVFNGLKNEANDTKQNINGVKFVFGETPYLELGQKKIELLCDAKDTKNESIETNNLIILSTPSNLAVGYGCLMYGDVKTNESKTFRGELAAGDTRVDATSGNKGLWAKSAPMPVILSTSKFKRYKVTISA